jgi:hypothetical protein
MERDGVVPEYIDGIRVTGVYFSPLSFFPTHILKRCKNPTNCSPCIFG